MLHMQMGTHQSVAIHPSTVRPSPRLLAGQREAREHHRHADLYRLGDPRGVALVASICEPDFADRSGHFFVPQTCPPHVDPETHDYLRLKGVFELPASNVCEMLIETYFHHVHPFFPVVEAKRFIETFESPRRNELSLHLLWSMFLAAANVCARSICMACMAEATG